MPITSVIETENNRWKKNAKKRKQKSKQTNKERKEQGGGTEVIVKGWELNDFAVHLS